jgi:hypothetical protein
MTNGASGAARPPRTSSNRASFPSPPPVTSVHEYYRKVLDGVCGSSWSFQSLALRLRQVIVRRRTVRVPSQPDGRLAHSETSRQRRERTRGHRRFLRGARQICSVVPGSHQNPISALLLCSQLCRVRRTTSATQPIRQLPLSDAGPATGRARSWNAEHA